MTSAYNAICNLLYVYAERIDRGDLAGAAELFRHAQVKSRDGVVDHVALLAFWKRMITLYEDGTPRTKHVVTNPIVEVDEAAGLATSRCYYQVLQAFPDQTIRIIASGRYYDGFERADGVWRFKSRDYTLMDMRGDLSRHVPNLSTGQS
jgi:3-phenylpropionate/cinnamic acid dioxygenase small subunit